MKLQSMAAACAAVALLSAGCAMLEPRNERFVAAPFGTTYSIARTDTGSFGSGSTRISGKVVPQEWRGEKLVNYETPEASLLVRPEGGFVTVLAKGNPVTSWDPPASFQWPLTVGKSWRASYKLTVHAANRTVPYSSMQRVEAYEDVTVPAGTFKAFRISTVDTLGNDNMQWFSPELGIFVRQSLRRTATHSQGEGTREIEIVSYTRGN